MWIKAINWILVWKFLFSRQHGWKLKRVQLQTLKLSSTGVCITTGYVRTWMCALMFRNNSHFSLCPPLSIICIPALPNNPEDRRIPVNRSWSLRSRQWIFGLSWYYARTDTLQQHNLFKPNKNTRKVTIFINVSVIEDLFSCPEKRWKIVCPERKQKRHCANSSCEYRKRKRKMRQDKNAELQRVMIVRGECVQKDDKLGNKFYHYFLQV